MGYRGLDIGPGISRYSDIIGSAYKDKVAQDQNQFEMAAKYGARLNPNQYVQNIFYKGPPAEGYAPNNIPMAAPVSYLNPRGDMVGPEGPPPPYAPPVDDGGRRPWSVEEPQRNPAYDVPPGIISKGEKYLENSLDKGIKTQEQGAVPASSPVQQIINRYANQEYIHPYILKQLVDLQEKEASLQARQSDPMLALVAGLLGKKDNSDNKQGRAPADPNIALARKMEMLRGLQKPFEFKPSARAENDTRAWEIDNKKYLATPRGIKWTNYQNQLDALGGVGQALGIVPTVKMVTVKDKSGKVIDRLPLEEARKKYPQFK